MSRVLADPVVRLLWAGSTTSRLGTSVSAVAMPLVALQVLGAGPLLVGLLTAATWLPWLVIGLPAGAWVDRLPARPVLVVADVVAVGLLASVPVAVAAGGLTAAHLLAVALLVGTCHVFSTAALTAWLPALLEPEQLVPANALLEGSASAAQVAGPGLAGLLAGAFGAAAGLLADAASFAVSATCLLAVRRTGRPRPAAARRRLRTEVAEGVRFVRTDPLLVRLALHGALSNLALVGYQVVLVVFLVRDLGLSSTSVGLLLAAGNAGGLVGAALVQRLSHRLGSARALVLCKAGAGPCTLLVPLAAPGPRLGLLVVGTLLSVGGIVAGNVLSGSFRQTYVPAGLLGRVSTSMQVVNLGTIPLGAVLAGALAGRIGAHGALWATVLLFAVAGLVLVTGPLRGRRDLPTAPPVPVAV